MNCLLSESDLWVQVVFNPAGMTNGVMPVNYWLQWLFICILCIYFYSCGRGHLRLLLHKKCPFKLPILHVIYEV